MGNFSRMSAQAIKPDAERWFTFDTLQPAAGTDAMRLRVVHAGDSNRAYRNDSVRRANEQIARATNKLTTAQLDALRLQDANVFARCVVKGWEHVFYDDGAAPEFNADNVEQFLLAIPPELFDRLRVYCKDPENFREVPQGDAGK